MERIESIVEASRLPNVRVGVIPWTKPVDVFCTHSFDLYDDTAAIIGTEVSSVPFVEPDHIAVYEDTFARLSEVAAFGNEARRELARIHADYRMLA